MTKGEKQPMHQNPLPVNNWNYLSSGSVAPDTFLSPVHLVTVNSTLVPLFFFGCKNLSAVTFDRQAAIGILWEILEEYKASHNPRWLFHYWTWRLTKWQGTTWRRTTWWGTTWWVPRGRVPRDGVPRNGVPRGRVPRDDGINFRTENRGLFTVHYLCSRSK